MLSPVLTLDGLWHKRKLNDSIGYNFPSLETIRPYLEPTGAGVSAEWARVTAARLRCIVTVGYPEIYSARAKVKNVDDPNMSAPFCYNSTITISPDGVTLAHYRKTHLYYTDETWAKESDTKWLTTSLPLNLVPLPECADRQDSEVKTVVGVTTTFGICMDLNPHQFTAPWTLYELASHTLATGTQLLLLSMAWLTLLSTPELTESPREPDLATLSYWIERLTPLVRNNDREVIVVLANRCGEEPDDARYAGSSWVGRVGRGIVKVWEVAGRAEEKLLCVDTDKDPPLVLASSRQGEGD